MLEFLYIYFITNSEIYYEKFKENFELSTDGSKKYKNGLLTFNDKTDLTVVITVRIYIYCINIPNIITNEF